jgi:dienelactone hydrolase
MRVTTSGRAVLLAAGWVVVGLAAPAWSQPTFPKPARYVPTPAERAAIERKVNELGKHVDRLPRMAIPRDLVDDVAVFLVAGQRALRSGAFFDRGDVVTVRAVLDRGLERARQVVEQGPPPWTVARGTLARGFTSQVDGSIQPCAVIVPDGLALSREARVRLDVVLHGRDEALSAARFLARFDGKPTPPGAEGKITLHVFGRGNNAYRWAGETDVFEAIDAVKRNYPVDDRRIVLRGFSMGGAGAWHLGLHHPSSWSSVEAGAGFTETRFYAQQDDLPPYVDKALHIYDAVDYALNACDVPIVGYGGANDPQLQASTHIVDALEGLGFALATDGLITRGAGIDFLRIVGAGMGHAVDPPSAKLMADFHAAHAATGGNLAPKRVRFVTYTLKYPRAAWLAVVQMKEHYKKTEVDAEIRDGKVVVSKADNVVVLALDRHAGATVVLGGQEFPLEGAARGLLPDVYFRRAGAAGWRPLDHEESRAVEENRDRLKHPGVQGPIDDAFTGPFVCVVGTGTPWSKAVGRWADDRLARFRDEWATFLHGDVRVKKDTDLNDDDIAGCHLVLFGDPGSNRVIARVLKGLPLTWTQKDLTLAGASYPSADHVPVLIAPNPLNPRRYVVLNSGHTFAADAFLGTNALLYPRLGDHAVFQVGGRDGLLRASGYFDEGWSLRGR